MDARKSFKMASLNKEWIMRWMFTLYKTSGVFPSKKKDISKYDKTTTFVMQSALKLNGIQDIDNHPELPLLPSLTQLIEPKFIGLRVWHLYIVLSLKRCPIDLNRIGIHMLTIVWFTCVWRWIMGKPYSLDLRERICAYVAEDNSASSANSLGTGIFCWRSCRLNRTSRSRN